MIDHPPGACAGNLLGEPAGKVLERPLQRPVIVPSPGVTGDAAARLVAQRRCIDLQHGAIRRGE
jgi:hypothetical protein